MKPRCISGSGRFSQGSLVTGDLRRRFATMRHTMRSFRLTITHRFDFGNDSAAVGTDLVGRPEAWDAVRETTGAFAISLNRQSLCERAQSAPELVARAKDIVDTVRNRGGRSLASYGVGGAVLEANISSSAPWLRLTLTESAPRTAARLRELFPMAEVITHDLRLDAPLPADLHLFHRVDTEFSDAVLASILNRFRFVPVLLVPTELLGVKGVLRELRTRLVKRNATRAGYVRSEASFYTLWRSSHVASPVAIGEVRAFLLEPRSPTTVCR